MNKQKARLLLMDFLYDEISAADKEKLETYLDDHPELFEELKELRKTQKLLDKMPETEAPKKMHMVEPRRRSFAMWWDDVKTAMPRSGWGKAALATAACLALFLIVGSIASMQFNTTQTGFSFSLGYGNKTEQSLNKEKIKHLITSTRQSMNQKPQQPQKTEQTLPAKALTEQEADQFFTDKEAKALLAKIQQQNKAMLAAFAKKMRKQDQKQLKRLVKYYQAQRLYDLKRIMKSLNRTQLASAYRWRKTNRLLGKFIRAAAIEKQ